MSNQFLEYYFKKIAGEKGYLTIAEATKALKDQGYKETSAKDAIEKADKNRDEKIDSEELMHHMDWEADNAMERKRKAAQAVCKELDKDGNGYFDKAEMKKVLEAAYGFEMDDESADEYVGYAFGTYDPEETGKISYATVVQELFGLGDTNVYDETVQGADYHQ